MTRATRNALIVELAAQPTTPSLAAIAQEIAARTGIPLTRQAVHLVLQKAGCTDRKQRRRRQLATAHHARTAQALTAYRQSPTGRIVAELMRRRPGVKLVVVDHQRVVALLGTTPIRVHFVHYQWRIHPHASGYYKAARVRPHCIHILVTPDGRRVAFRVGVSRTLHVRVRPEIPKQYRTLSRLARHRWPFLEWRDVAVRKAA
jgi:hypothetical protein